MAAVGEEMDATEEGGKHELEAATVDIGNEGGTLAELGAVREMEDIAVVDQLLLELPCSPFVLEGELD